MNNELLLGLIISASLGALIGLVRQWEDQQENASENITAGLRTFALWGVLGTTSAYVSIHHFPFFFPAAFMALALFLTVSQWIVFRGGEAPGLTTFTAAMLTFMSGGLVSLEQTPAAVVVAVLMIILIASKKEIHNWTRHFTPKDIRSALVFAAITGIILPMVPDKDIGPLQAFNPFSTWLMVVFISGMGFVGYVMMRLLGAHAGIAVTGLAGGLASSTAATIAFSRRSKEEPELSGSFALAVVLACSVMIMRVAVIVLVLDTALFLRLWLPLLIFFLPGGLYVAWSWWFRQGPEKKIETPNISNPLSLSLALKFAAIYAVVVFLVKAVSAYGSSGAGLYWVSFLSGLTDMDAITLSLAQKAQGNSADYELLARAILLAAMSNTVLKLGFAVSAGSREMRREMLVSLGATLVVGAVVFFVI